MVPTQFPWPLRDVKVLKEEVVELLGPPPTKKQITWAVVSK